MEIKFKNKPSEELINKYCKKLEEFLSAHKLSISIQLRNEPLRLESYINGNLTEINYLWIENVIVNGHKIAEISVDLFDIGIDENVTDEKIWHDAWHIQDQVYRQLNLKPALLDDSNWKNDTYWKLWDHLKKIK